MNDYLAGDIEDVPIQTTGLWEENFFELRLVLDTPMSVEYAQLRYFYVISMRAGSFVIQAEN